MIPAIFHRVVGASPDPVEDEYWRRLQELHPAWQFKTWRDPLDPASFELGDLFDRCASGAQLADLVRLEILWKEGGVYVDADCEPVRPLDALREARLFVGTEDGNHLTNAVLGCEPGHLAIRACMDAIRTEDRLSLAVPPNRATGPGLLTAVMGNFSDVSVLPPEVFYPVHPIRPDQFSRHTLLVHRWAASWVTHERRTIRTFCGDTLRRSRKKLRAGLGAVKKKWRASSPPPTTTFATPISPERLLISTVPGFPMFAFPDDHRVTPDLASRGVCDPAFVRFAAKVLRPGDHAIDVGANVGFFTLCMLQSCGRFGRVYAYESDPAVFELLCENIAMSSWSASAEPVCSALDAERVDDRVPTYSPVRLVRIDADGREAAVLEGMTGLLDNRCVDHLVLEVARGDGGARWLELVAGMKNLAERGARVSVIAESGALRPVSLGHVLSVGEFSHVVFSFE